mgnify:CR=1 FL=1
MINKNLKKLTIILFLTFVTTAQAIDDVAEMSGISEAAGSSAAAAVSQMATDTSTVTKNIAAATGSLGEATSEMASALDVSIAQAQSALSFATKSLAAGDMTAAIQTMSLVEGVTDMALGAIPSPTGLDMQGIFALQTIFATAMLVSEVHSGYLADVFGRRNIIFAGAIVSGLGHNQLIFADSFAALVVYEFTLGIGASLLSGADLALLYDTELALNRGVVSSAA